MKINVGATLLLLLTFIMSDSAYALRCSSPGNTDAFNGIGGSFNIRVNLAPSVQAGGTIVVSLGDYIQCNSIFSIQDGIHAADQTTISSASVLPLFNYISGSVSYYGQPYNLPLTAATASHDFNSATISPWNVVLSLKVNGSGPSGVVIPAGQTLATLVMNGQTLTDSGSANPFKPITWNIVANNSVVLPSPACEAVSNNFTITLPDYSGTGGTTGLLLGLHCSQTTTVSYYLTGTTTDSAHTIFKNTASTFPAGGLGVQLSTAANVPIATNTNMPGGIFGPDTSPNVALGIRASYARTSGPVTAGNVQSIVTLTLVYQ